MPRTIAQLQDLVRDFVHDRDWEQFHTPRNLTLALCGEAGELAAQMQWVTDEDINSAAEGSPLRTAIGHEVADVMIYLLRLADILDLNLDEEVQNKIRINEQRYPTDKARGSAAKYTAHGATKEQTFKD